MSFINFRKSSVTVLTNILSFLLLLFLHILFHLIISLIHWTFFGDFFPYFSIWVPFFPSVMSSLLLSPYNKFFISYTLVFIFSIFISILLNNFWCFWSQNFLLNSIINIFEKCKIIVKLYVSLNQEATNYFIELKGIHFVGYCSVIRTHTCIKNKQYRYG